MNVKKIIILIVLIFFLEILDNTIVPFLSVYGFYPSFLFIFAICYSILNGRWSALKIGIATGAVQDLFFVNAFGINTLINMILCVLAAEIGKNLFRQKRLIPVLTVFLIVFLKGIFIFCLTYVFGIYTNVYKSIFIALYSFVVAIIVYKPIYNLCQKPYMIKRWKF